ncbi:helix-turn-helix domain-containing protein [Paenibacillus sp. WLX1005]|uniref:AraC family transcriptional regulator n=1 Tax=Paenibacillus sp. WLX1005 TaxID=3243766 RepID=UPI0039842694
MSEYNPLLHNAQRLPVLDWNISFFGAHTQKVERGWHVPSNLHLAFEIIWVLEGGQRTCIEQDTYELAKGDILIIPPGFHHEIQCNHAEGMTYFCAHFDIDDAPFIMNMAQKCDLIYRQDQEYNGELQRILKRWVHMINHDTPYSFRTKMEVQIVLSELLILLDRMMEQSGAPVHPASINSSKYAKEIAEMIKTSFKQQVLHPEYNEPDDEGLHIERIIQSVGLSPGYGYEVFKKVYGCSPRHYLSQLKLKEARALIKKPELSIQSISKRLGYKNASHFSRQFKRWTGVSPLEYRAVEG